MTIRKVQVTWQFVDHNKRTDPWSEMRRNCRNEIIIKLERDYGFQTSAVVNSAFAIFGWLDSDLFDDVRALPEVVSLYDDYPYLMQEDEMRPEWVMPHPFVVEEYLKNSQQMKKAQRDREETKK